MNSNDAYFQVGSLTTILMYHKTRIWYYNKQAKLPCEEWVAAASTCTRIQSAIISCCISLT